MKRQWRQEQIVEYEHLVFFLATPKNWPQILTQDRYPLSGALMLMRWLNFTLITPTKRSGVNHVHFLTMIVSVLSPKPQLLPTKTPRTIQPVQWATLKSTIWAGIDPSLDIHILAQKRVRYLRIPAILCNRLRHCLWDSRPSLARTLLPAKMALKILCQLVLRLRGDREEEPCHGNKLML